MAGKRPDAPPTETVSPTVIEMADTTTVRHISVRLERVATEQEHLIKQVDELSEIARDLHKKAIQIDTTVKVGGALIVVFLGAFWFTFGPFITTIVNQAVAAALVSQSVSSSAPPAEKQ